MYNYRIYNYSWYMENIYFFIFTLNKSNTNQTPIINTNQIPIKLKIVKVVALKWDQADCHMIFFFFFLRSYNGPKYWQFFALIGYWHSYALQCKYVLGDNTWFECLQNNVSLFDLIGLDRVGKTEPNRTDNANSGHIKERTKARARSRSPPVP